MEGNSETILTAEYKCRKCGNTFNLGRKLPANRKIIEIVAEATMNRPNPLIHPMSFHLCETGKYGIGELISIKQ